MQDVLELKDSHMNARALDLVFDLISKRTLILEENVPVAVVTKEGLYSAQGTRLFGG
jgi:hypothetical protein